MRNHREILESRGMPHHFSLCHLLKCLVELAKEFAGSRGRWHLTLMGGIRNRAKRRQRPDGIGKFGADAADAAVGETGSEQPIAPADAGSRTRLIAQADQKLQSVHDIWFELAEKCPVLLKLALAHEREHGDGGVLPVLTSAFREDLPALRLLGPLGA